MTSNHDQIISFDRESYKNLCMEMRDILIQEKDLKVKKDEIRKKLIDMAGGTRMENGIKITKRVSKGTVDYKKIAHELFSQEELDEIVENYRNPDREYFDVRVY